MIVVVVIVIVVVVVVIVVAVVVVVDVDIVIVVDYSSSHKPLDSSLNGRFNVLVTTASSSPSVVDLDGVLRAECWRS